MAILKLIENENGVPLSYHRVVSVNNITNVHSIIEVASYVSEKQRLIEQAYQELQKKSTSGQELTEEEQLELDNGINVYISTEYINIDYDKDLNVDNAYEYLKELDKFKGSEDK